VNGAAPGRIRVEPVRREWADPCRTATQSSPNGSPCPLRKTGQASQALPIIIAAAQGDEQDQWGPHLFFGDDGALIGNGSWKGPPVDGVAELGYAVAPARQGRGVATAVVRELVRRARVAGLRMVFAHTLAAESASTSVLARCGFAKVAELIDPDEGPVWRWEYHLEHTPANAHERASAARSAAPPSPRRCRVCVP
jgi:RimJ/RimL family protein N-acetyltransferase